MRVWLKPDRMAALGISPSQVRDALAANNYLSALGSTKGSMVSVNLVANTDLQTAEEFRQLVVKEENGDGRPARRHRRRRARRRELRPGRPLQRRDRGLHGHLGAADRQHARRDAAACARRCPDIQAQLPAGMKAGIPYDSTRLHPGLDRRGAQDAHRDAAHRHPRHLPLPRLGARGDHPGRRHPDLAHRRRVPDAGRSASPSTCSRCSPSCSRSAWWSTTPSSWWRTSSAICTMGKTPDAGGASTPRASWSGRSSP